MIHREFIDEMRAGHLEVDCPMIRLVPANDQSAAKEFLGSGIIRNAKVPRQFEVKVFLGQERANEVDCLTRGSQWSGRYDLVASDTEGNQWSAARVKVSPTSSTTLVGNFVQLSIMSAAGDLKSELHEVEITLESVDYVYPNHEGRELWRKTADSAPQLLYVSSPAMVMDVNGFHIYAEQDAQKCLVFNVSSAMPITEAFVDLLVQSAQFVYGHALNRQAFTSINRDSDIITTILQRPTPQAQMPVAAPPVSLSRGHDPDDFWRLFKTFLQYLLSDQATHSKYVQQSVWSVMRVWDCSVDVIVLAISVAIEGITKHCFRKYGFIDQSFADDIAVFLDCLPIDKKSKNRIKNALPNKNKFSAKEALIRLQGMDLIPVALVNEWGKTRNVRAHADIAETQDIQAIADLYEQSQRLLQLFYFLVFLAIGYTGPFTDYSVVGWPDRVFEKVHPKNAAF